MRLEKPSGSHQPTEIPRLSLRFRVGAIAALIAAVLVGERACSLIGIRSSGNNVQNTAPGDPSVPLDLSNLEEGVSLMNRPFTLPIETLDGTKYLTICMREDSIQVGHRTFRCTDTIPLTGYLVSDLLNDVQVSSHNGGMAFRLFADDYGSVYLPREEAEDALSKLHRTRSQSTTVTNIRIHPEEGTGAEYVLRALAATQGTETGLCNAKFEDITTLNQLAGNAH
jgi:hypothetical protein